MIDRPSQPFLGTGEAAQGPAAAALANAVAHAMGIRLRDMPLVAGADQGRPQTGARGAAPSCRMISATISAGAAGDIDHDRPLVGAGLLQGRELAVEQAERHEVLVPRRHPLMDQLARTLQVDQPDFGPVADQDVAIGTLQRRAGDDARLAAAHAIRRSGARWPAARAAGRHR